MGDYMFRPPLDEDMGLFIGLAGGTGTGKTWSAMEMATGIVGPGKRFAVIDTENRRASHYKKYFAFDVFNFEPPFASKRYGEAVEAAYKAGYKAIVLDSFSHEHEGFGGYLDYGNQELTTKVERYMKKYPNSDEYKVIEKMTPSSWIKPKAERKRMRQVLLACSSSIPVIFCFRAEEKVWKSIDGKLVAREKPEWEPTCDKAMPFEMTVFFMLHKDAPGVPHVYLKPLQEQHKPLFPLNKPLGRESGRLIAEWATGKERAKVNLPEDEKSEEQKPMPPTDTQKSEIKKLMIAKGLDTEAVQKSFWKYVMTKNDSVLAQAFIDRFEEYYELFSRYLDSQNAA